MDYLTRFTIIFIVLWVAGCSTHKNGKGAYHDPFLPVAAQFKSKEAREKHKGLNGRSNDQVVLEANETQKTFDSTQIHGSALLNRESETGQTVYFLNGADDLDLLNRHFDFPVTYNSDVKKWINYYLGRGREFFIKYSERAGRYGPLIGNILEENGLPRDLLFLAMAESGLQNHVRSPAYAVGTWQFMPYTAKRHGLEINWFIDERRDPIKSTLAACLYLKKLYDQFDSWELAASAYNAGEGKIARAIKYYRTKDFWKLRKGRILKQETKNYVPKIMAIAIIGKNLKSFGINELNFYDPLEYFQVELPGGTDLVLLSEELGIPYEKLSYYNPELLRWLVPPTATSYSLRLPLEFKDQWENCCQDRADSFYPQFQLHQIRESRSSLSKVSQTLGIPIDVLQAINPETKRGTLQKGDQINLPFRIGHDRRNPMYADLFKRPKQRKASRRRFQSRVSNFRGQRNNLKKERNKNQKKIYVVKKGDTLWRVSRKTGIALDSLIKSNKTLISMRMIREGDRLILK